MYHKCYVSEVLVDIDLYDEALSAHVVCMPVYQSDHTDSRGILSSISCWTESFGRARTLPLLKKDRILGCITSL